MYALHQVGKRNQNATTEFTEKYSPPEKASSGQNYGQQWIHNHQVNNTPIDVTQGDNNDSQSNENRNCAEDVEVSNGSDKANTSPHNHRIDLTSASNVDADSPMAGQQIHDDANADAIMEDVQSLVMLMRDEEKCALKKIIELPTENRRQLMNALLLFDQLPSEQRDSLASSY